MTEKNTTWTYHHLPESLNDLNQLTGEFNSSPESAVAGCVAALKVLSRSPEEGKAMLQLLYPDASGNILRLSERQLTAAPWIIDACFSGTSPENGYTIPEEKTLLLSTNRYSGTEEEGRIKFFVECSGADSPRPVTVRRDQDGNWYPFEWSSLLVGIRKPVEN